MKKKKPHQFKYKDPINKSPEGITQKTEPKKVAEETKTAIADFKRAGLTILVFIGLILVLYFLRNELRLNELINILNF